MADQTKSVAETMEYKEGQQNLTEDQVEAIAQEALKEFKDGTQGKEAWEIAAEEQIEAETAAEQKAEKEAQEKAEKEAQEKEETEKAEKEAQEKEQKEAELQAQETEAQTKERLDKKKEAADKEAKEKEEKAKAAAAQPYKMPAEERAKAIEALALKESLTLQEAEEQIVKEEAIVNKYKNPVEMAKALRESQREMDRARTELEKAKAASVKTPAPIYNTVKEYVKAQITPIMPELIPKYRKEYPDLTDGLEDEKVATLIERDAIAQTTKTFEKNEEQLKGSAETKRAELIMGLADVDRAFIPDIKAQLERCSPRQILSKDFKFQDLIDWAKGRQLDRLLKEAEDRGFKRGQENSKIIGEKLPGGGTKTGSGSKGGVKTAGSRLSDEQKERALDMFDGTDGMDDEAKFAAFIEVYPEQFSK